MIRYTERRSNGDKQTGAMKKLMVVGLAGSVRDGGEENRYSLCKVVITISSGNLKVRLTNQLPGILQKGHH